MKTLKEMVELADFIMISGHIRPDGDCVGACVATCLYLRKVFPEKRIQVYLSSMPENFRFLDPQGTIILTELPKDKPDIYVSVDSSTLDRLGAAEDLYRSTKDTVCIDHHISNQGFGRYNHIVPEASSTCEVLFDLMDLEYIDEVIASALYIGIIFDSGVFRYSNTSAHTMQVAGELMKKGIPFGKYIDECFYQRTYVQTQLLGRTLLESMRIMDGRCIVASISMRIMEFYEATTEDIDGIIDQLRLTKGIQVAILLHETATQEYKVSMRSNADIDVSRVAAYFGGGGHVKAAGVTMRGSIHDVINNLTRHIEMQMK